MVSIVLALVWFLLPPHTSARTVSKGRAGYDVRLFCPTAPATESTGTAALTETLRGLFPLNFKLI